MVMIGMQRSLLMHCGMQEWRLFFRTSQSHEQIVHAEVQEDVEFIGLSILSGAHNVILPHIMELLEEQGAGDIKVVV